MTLVGLAMVLGGGGTVNPQTEMVLQVLTAVIILPLFAHLDWQRGLGPVHRFAWILASLVLIIPALQLVPLPPSIWHTLPGRTIEVQSLALVQAEQFWMPLTLSPARTFASLLAMICSVLLMLQVSRLSLQGRNWLCAVIVAVGALSLVIGVLQLSRTGGFEWSLYSEFNLGFLVGFQANRNAEADIMLITMLAAGVLASDRLSDGRKHMLMWTSFVAGMLALLVGLIMTGSRTGISLIVVAAPFLILMIQPMVRRRKILLYGLGGIASLGVVSVGILLQFQSVQRVAARFALTHDARWDLWADTWYAIGQVWPVGSGIGTIVPMLEAAERLEVVDSTFPVRAHNDWLEWTLEAGLPGMLVLGTIILALSILIVRAFVSANRPGTRPARRSQVLFGTGVLLTEGLHAIVDYPMRSMSLAALTAVAVAFLLEPAAMERKC
ncbi:MAG: O-antigen ligase family protein [Sphingomonadales bacterium]|nr:O-antigen ligase family protein [Sphingomonadales bacterium]